MTQMTTALTTLFSSADRQRARFQSERLEGEEDHDVEQPPQQQQQQQQQRLEPEAEAVPEPPSVVTVSVSPTSPRRRLTGGNRSSTSRENQQQQPHQQQTDRDDRDEEEIPLDGLEDLDDLEGFPRFMTTIRSPQTTMTLAELEEERELARRRSSACILLSAFVLFRLWVLAIEEKDFGLLLLCLVGTSWTARWIGHNREREEELDHRIAHYIERAEGSGGTEVDRNELRMLSFQAQLALAIMESQRQMMQGGYGHPDGTVDTQGVSDDAKARWERFQYCAEVAAAEKTKAGYGSVSQKDEKDFCEEPHCSICLGDYENGEDLVKLPCNHLYHDECISSWTSNHVKCPLCNLDLETVVSAATSTSSVPSASSSTAMSLEDSVV